MTLKLYDIEPYDTYFDAIVLESTEYKGKTGYVFDKTLFFPEEGGQSSDKGLVNGFNVTDVQISGGRIIHFIDGELKVGDSVHGEIDWNHRFRNMQCHSAEHIFSGLVYSKFGFNNVGFHLSNNTATMDYDGFLSPEDIKALEFRTNEIIIENRPIKAEYPEPERLQEIEYRSKKELSGPVRIVTVEGVDVCACCAPHVRSTAEIGLFKVLSFEKYKGGVRIHYLAGFRAIADYEVRLSALRDISATLSAKPYSESEAVSSLNEENKDLKFRIVNITNQFIESKIRNSFHEGDTFLLYIGTTEEVSCMDFAARVLRGLVPSFASFFGSDEEGYRFIIESSSLNTDSLLNRLKNEFYCKCGGKNGSFRGSIDLKAEDLIKNFSTIDTTFGV